MIKTLLNFTTGLFSEVPVVVVDKWAEERFVEENLTITQDVELKSNYYGTISTEQYRTWLDAQSSHHILPGDMELIIIGYAGGKHTKLPDGFHCVLDATHHKEKMGVLIGYRVRALHRETTYRIVRETKSLFVNLLNLRGPDLVLGSAGRYDTAEGDRGLAYTPRVRTAEGGVVVSAYLYGDPLIVDVEGQKTLTAMKNRGKGFATGIGAAPGGMSDRIKAISDEAVKGNGHDIALALSLF